MQNLNFWAILAAAAAAFVIGGLWYSPLLLGSLWKKANGFGAEDTPRATGKVFAISFVLSLVMAINLAMFLNNPSTTTSWGATAGFLAGFGWVAMGIGVVSLFERRPWSYVIVNGGYLTASLTIMGAILGAWR
ncbi:MAG TPA: DUF1761 domain-containing protein [Bryobacteraceae bacterium]|nr:DUF1761 domain-containing protein [Bryobacteraceae bacterium]